MRQLFRYRFARMTILITGGAGFIGSHLIRHLVQNYPDYLFVNLDAMTYAAELSRLTAVKDAPNYRFVKGNINDSSVVEQVFTTYQIKAVIHLAAESHVDQSIDGPMPFANTNIIGTMNLLNTCRSIGKKNPTIGFITSVQMRSMGLWEKKVFLTNKALINLDHPMRHRKQVQIIWFAPMEKPMVCLM